MRMSSALALLVVGATAAPAQSTDTARLDVRPGSKVWIEGGSNLRDWSCNAATFDARVDIDAAFAWPDESAVLGEGVRRVSVKVAVRDLKCGNSIMDNNLYRALKAGDPSTPSDIIGIFNASRAAKQGSALETQGTIEVAGVERNVRLRITMERLVDGMVKARGSVPLLMTDFGVTPPTALFGLVRSHNDVVVKFELLIARQAVPARRGR